MPVTLDEIKTNPEEGDWYYDEDRNLIHWFIGGEWIVWTATRESPRFFSHVEQWGPNNNETTTTNN